MKTPCAALEIGPPLASDAPGSAPLTHACPAAPGASRSGSTPSCRRLRSSLAYPTTAQWAFLTSTPPPAESQRQYYQHRHAPPSRPTTARDSTTSTTPRGRELEKQLAKRPATSRSCKRTLETRRQSSASVFTPRGSRGAIQEAMRREREQEQYVDPLLGRSVEPRGQAKSATNTADGGVLELLARARGAPAASVSAVEQLRVRAFQARANGEYLRAIELYSRLVGARAEDIEARFHLAVCLERTGQLSPALAAYEQVQTLSGQRHAFAFYNMGNLCMRTERVAQAIDYYSRAIAATKGSNGSVKGPQTLSGVAMRGPTPMAFYRQRGAAYRKHGEFEKAARDYALVRREDDSAAGVMGALYSDEPLYTASGPPGASKKTPRQPKSSIDSEESEDEDEDEQLLQETQEDEETEEEAGDASAAWLLARAMAVARSPQWARSESDLQCLVDFMQQRFPLCAALRPEVCLRLCRALVLSPDGAISMGTPVVMEQPEDATGPRRGRALFFLFTGRVAIYKTIKRTFQSSSLQEEELDDQPQRELPGDGQEAEQQDPEEYNATWETLCGVAPDPVRAEWRKSQLQLCELDGGAVFGHQGKFSDAPRAYSAVATENCDVGVLSWHQWWQIDRAQREAEQERTHRFLAMTPVFRGLPAAEIRELALQATPTKVVGTRAVCCEGQPVDGLLVVREGELCQFSPCGLGAPPDLAVSFELSGALAATHPGDGRSQNGPSFFAQLETAGDPLAFLRVNETFHGFLPHDFVPHKQRELLRLARSKPSQHGTSSRQPRAKSFARALRRGEVFCASSSWVPPRESRHATQGTIRGVACAKSALVSPATAELLFISSADLSRTLSLSSRTRLHRRLQELAADAQRESKPVTRLGFCQPAPMRRSANLLEQLVRDAHWSKYKQELVQTVLRERGQRSWPQRDARGGSKTR